MDRHKNKKVHADETQYYSCVKKTKRKQQPRFFLGCGSHQCKDTTWPEEHTFVSELPFEGRVALSAILIHPDFTTGTERSCSVTQVSSSPNTRSRPPPMTCTPRINRGFGHIRQFLEPSGGAFYKSVPPWQSPPGIGPADLGQLWLVAYTGSQPLGICQRHSCPHPLPLPHIHASLLCSPKQTNTAIFFFLAE